MDTSMLQYELKISLMIGKLRWQLEFLVERSNFWPLSKIRSNVDSQEKSGHWKTSVVFGISGRTFEFLAKGQKSGQTLIVTSNSSLENMSGIWNFWSNVGICGQTSKIRPNVDSQNKNGSLERLSPHLQKNDNDNNYNRKF